MFTVITSYSIHYTKLYDDLLRWMRDKDYDPAVIILTSYGKFEYAKQAIEFQCLDYLLKPVSQKTLLEAVQRGIGRYFERRKADANNKLAEYWNSGQKSYNFV